MRRSIAILLAALLTGCSSTWQTTEEVQAVSYAAASDSVPRYAGKLRRLVALAPVIEPAEEKCASRLPANLAPWVEEEVQRFLVDWKGYQLQPATDVELVQVLAPWQEKTPEQREPPAAQAEQLRALAAAHGADGVLVVHAAVECIDTADVALMLIAVGMPRFYSKVFGRNFSAGIYDASGALVWQSYSGLGPVELDGSITRAMVTGSVEGLFGLLENAIPDILLR